LVLNWYSARILGISGTEIHFHQALGEIMFELKTIALFLVTAIAEIVGCYLPYLWLNQNKSAWLLIPAALSLALFAWLLSLHPAAAGRVYEAYGVVYIFVAILWLWSVDGIRPTTWDLVGASVAMAGMAIIMFAPRHT
jgi:small multidrug resistance family-3 protein